MNSNRYREWLETIEYREWTQNIHFCHVNGRWYFLSPDNTVVIGPFDSEGTAQEQFRQRSKALWDDNKRRLRGASIESAALGCELNETIH